MIDDNELLTVEQVAQRLGVGRTKIYQLLDRRELRSIQIDRSRRIPASEIPAFVARKLKEAEHAEEAA